MEINNTFINPYATQSLNQGTRPAQRTSEDSSARQQFHKPDQQNDRSQLATEKLQEIRELKPLTIDQKQHPATRVFQEIAQYEPVFHLVDTYA